MNGFESLLVCSGDGVIHVLDLLDGLHRSKDLLSADLHVIGDVTKYSGLDKEAFVSMSGPAGEELGPLLLARVNITQDLTIKELYRHACIEYSIIAFKE